MSALHAGVYSHMSAGEIERYLGLRRRLARYERGHAELDELAKRHGAHADFDRVGKSQAVRIQQVWAELQEFVESANARYAKTE